MKRALFGSLATLLAVAVHAETLSIDGAWVREPAPGQGAVAIYLRLANGGAGARVLNAARVEGAASATLHEHAMAEGMMSMRPAGAVTVPPGGELRLEPGGYHLMVFGLARVPAAGDRLPFCLLMADGAELCAQADVRGLGQ